MGSLHKWFLLFLILVLPVFVAKQYRILRDKKGASYVVEADFYNANPYSPNDKFFIVMITAHNVAPFIEKSLTSVFKQNYGHYRVVVLDQDSTDGTYEKVVDFIKNLPAQDKIEVVRRSSEGALFQAYYQIVKEAHDHDIIVHLPGGDWLSNEHSLATLNHIYSNQDVWLTYPQYIDYPSYKKGIFKVSPKKHVHKRRVHRTPWASSPLKTFYAGILKQVAIEQETVSVLILGEQALMLPMAEIGKSHVRFIPEVLYIHTSKGDHEEEEEIGQLYLDETDVIFLSRKGGVFSLHALENNLTLPKQVTVIQEAELKSSFLETLRHEYVLLIADQSCLERKIDLKKCVQLLKKHKAHGCYFGQGIKIKSPRWIDQGVYVGDIYPEGLCTALYEKAQLMDDLRSEKVFTPRRGLFFCDAKRSEY